MPTEVILPKVDMDMASGKISRWFAKEGDRVTKGDPLFEIETDKAAMEVDAPASGTLRGVTGEEGVDIPVGATLAWIDAEGEEAASAASESEAVPGRAQADAGEPATPSCEEREDGRRAIRATPLARRLARERGLDLSRLAGSGPAGRIQREDVERAAGAAPEQPAAPASIAGDASSPGLAVVRLREGEGAPILLIHGFGSESASWRPLLSELPEGRPVLGLDLPGHGASIDAQASGFSALVTLAEEAVLVAGISTCHLVGHSLGGAVATALASGSATDVRSLMLIASAGFGAEIDTAFAEGFAAATQEAPIRSWLRHLSADPAAISDGLVRATARGRADGRQAEAQSRLLPSLFSNGTQHFEVRSQLSRLAMPVKIVAGAEDRVVPVRHFAGLPGRIALHVFPGTGHMPQIERKADVAALLLELVR